jgi:hypothetical protein
VWVGLVVVAFLSPALKDGLSFGPSALGGQLSYFTYVPGLVVHNNLNGDVITQAVAWNRLDWLAVHHGQIPLWNDYSAGGMPLLLNFESAAFSLPALVGYLFPLASSYLVVVAVKLLVAGTGTYVAARLVGVGPTGSALAATTFMLSGSLSGWLGWAVSGPLVWAGWLLVGALLCWRPRRQRAGGVIVLALATAFAVYGGFPETLVLLAIGMASVVLIGGAASARAGRARPQAVAAGVARLAAGVAAGVALSAPLWLPGLAVLRQSARAGENGTGGLPAHALGLLLAQGYDGLPTPGSTWTGPANYYEATAYVGVLALALALLAVLAAWRRPIVAALGGAALVCLATIYVAPVQELFTDLGGGAIATQRMLPVLGFCAAMLAGLGTETLSRSWREPRIQRSLLAGILVLAGALAYMLASANSGGVTATELSARRHALVWPAVLLSALLAGLAAAVARSSRSGGAAGPVGGAALRAACVLLLAAQSAYLVFAGAGLNGYSSQPYPVDAALTTLKHLVGDNLVALDGPNPGDVTRWTGTGIYPEMNAGYGIRELAIHDPVLPPAYLRTWPDQAATSSAGLGNNIFAPSIGSAALARLYGASFILASPGRVPVGAVFVARIKVALVTYVWLYRVPRAERFSFQGNSGARVLAAARTGNNTWRLSVRVASPSALTLRVTYLPGWHVEADGRSLPARTDGPFVAVTVPAGTRSIVLTYWPGGLSAGFALALFGLAWLIVLIGAESFRRRQHLLTSDAASSA